MHIHVHVRVCTYPAFLHQICEHDDTAGIHLPDHPPEVIGGVWEGALGSDICTFPLVTLYTHVSKNRDIFIVEILVCMYGESLEWFTSLE